MRRDSQRCSSRRRRESVLLSFFSTDTATTEIYTLSLHDALPISRPSISAALARLPASTAWRIAVLLTTARSEEHTSELQSPVHLVCRLLLEKKKTLIIPSRHTGQGTWISPPPPSLSFPMPIAQSQ